jgi:hypothetical protein
MGSIILILFSSFSKYAHMEFLLIFGNEILLSQSPVAAMIPADIFNFIILHYIVLVKAILLKVGTLTTFLIIFDNLLYI